MTTTINYIRCCSSALKAAMLLSLVFFGAQGFAQHNNTIMIHKTATGAAADLAFPFTGTGSGFPEEFTLVNGQFRTISGLASGHYTITESSTDGWRVGNIRCEGEPGASSSWEIISSGSNQGDPDTFDAGDDSVSIHLSGGEVVECEVFNEATECGDSVVDTNEFCDPGIVDEEHPNFVAGCREDCTFCGDGEINGGEQCETSDANCSEECTIQGSVKIVKRMISHNFETIPADGFRFLIDSDLDNEFNLKANTLKFFTNLSAGEHTFYELRPFVPTPNPPGNDIESQGWDMVSVECVCLISEVGQTCGSTFTSNLDNRDEQLLEVPAAPHAVLGSFTVNLVGGETVVCTVTNEDQVCPPELQSPPAGSGNNNQAQNTNTGGLASTNPVATSSSSGCSSLGAGMAGLSTMLMLAMPLIVLRIRRQAKSKA